VHVSKALASSMGVAASFVEGSQSALKFLKENVLQAYRDSGTSWSAACARWEAVRSMPRDRADSPDLDKEYVIWSNTDVVSSWIGAVFTAIDRLRCLDKLDEDKRRALEITKDLVDIGLVEASASSSASTAAASASASSALPSPARALKEIFDGSGDDSDSGDEEVEEVDEEEEDEKVEGKLLDSEAVTRRVKALKVVMEKTKVVEEEFDDAKEELAVATRDFLRAYRRSKRIAHKRSALKARREAIHKLAQANPDLKRRIAEMAEAKVGIGTRVSTVCVVVDVSVYWLVCVLVGLGVERIASGADDADDADDAASGHVVAYDAAFPAT